MDITANYHKGADTSNIAFASTPSKIRFYHRARILEKLEEIGDATCSELERILNLSHQTASARIAELHKDNQIEDTGERRLTQYGRPARVYRLKERT